MKERKKERRNSYRFKQIDQTFISLRSKNDTSLRFKQTVKEREKRKQGKIL